MEKIRSSLIGQAINLIDLPFYRNTFYLMINLIISFVFGIVFWIVAARLLTPSNVGIASAFIAPNNFLSVLFLLGANHSILRFSQRIFKDPKLLFSIIWLTVGLSGVGGVLSAIVLFGSGFLEPVNSSIMISAFAYLMIVAGTVTNTLCEAAFTAMGKPQKLIIRNLMLGIFRVSILFLFSGKGSYGFVLAYSLGLGLAGLINLFLLYKHAPASGQDLLSFWHPEIKEIIGFAFPNHVANLLAGIPAMLLPIIVYKLLGAETNGYFTLAWTISMVARTVLTAASATLLAEGVRDSRILGKHIGNSLFFLLLITSASVLPLILFPKWVLGFFDAAYTRTGVLALPLLAISIIPSVLATVFVAAERVGKCFNKILIQSVLSCALGSLLPWLGARYFDYGGFLVAYLISQLLVGIYNLMQILHLRPIKNSFQGHP